MKIERKHTHWIGVALVVLGWFMCLINFIQQNLSWSLVGLFVFLGGSVLAWYDYTASP